MQSKKIGVNFEMKFYEKTWFIVLMALFIPPVAIVLILAKKKNWNKILKIAVTAVLAFWSLLWVVALFVPADSVDTDTTTTQAVTETTTKEIVTTVEEPTTQKVTTTKEGTTEEETTEKISNTITQKAEVTQKVEEKTTVKPTANTTKEQKEETTQKVIKETTTKKTITTTKDPDASKTVYITATGKRYHYENPCGNGTYYAVSLSEAKARNLTPCEKCVLH